MTALNKSILIVGNFGLGALEHQFLKYLKILGWDVFTFDIQAPVQKLKNKSFLTKLHYKVIPNTFYSEVNAQLLRYTEETKPLVTLIFKGMEIFPNTLREIKLHTELLVNYNPDHPFFFYAKGSGNSNVKNSIKLYDLYGTYSKNTASQLLNSYHTTSFVIPFGYDPEIKIQRSNQFSNHFGFVGAFDHERLAILKNLSKFPIEVYGDQKWAKLIKLYAENSFKVFPTPLFNETYASYCESCLGIFNFLRPHNIQENSHNMRTFEVPAYGGLSIANRTSEQSEFFEEDKEAIYFDELEELKDKLGFLLKNQHLIKSLKTNAYNRTQKSGYSYLHRMQSLDLLLNEYV